MHTHITENNCRTTLVKKETALAVMAAEGLRRAHTHKHTHTHTPQRAIAEQRWWLWRLRALMHKHSTESYVYLRKLCLSEKVMCT